MRFRFSLLRNSRFPWLYRISYSDAEPPERWFNRAFLALYGVAGFLVVFNWERTVSSCTNFQYRHRDMFSCPSTGRIALTWVIGAILVGSAFASRYVLHKRLRATYVPLLLLELAIALASLWLRTHHPVWGVPR